HETNKCESVVIEESKDLTADQIGDVITFSTEEDLLITHRITEVKQDGEVYTTKGDANNAADLDPVMSDNIVGSYTGFTIPYLGYVLNFANTAEGAALLLIVPGVLLLFYSGFMIWQAFRHLDKERKAIKTEEN